MPAPANTDLQRSTISLLASIATLQGSSSTDLLISQNTLIASGNTLKASANTLQASVNTLQASTNALITNSMTDLQISTNTLLGAVNYVSKGQAYSSFGLTSDWGTFVIGFTTFSQMYNLTSGAVGGVSVSYDGGSNVHGSVHPGETITLDRLKTSTVAMKCASNADPTVRIWGWG